MIRQGTPALVCGWSIEMTHSRSTAAAAVETIRDALTRRFGEELAVDPTLAGLDTLAGIAAHRTIRRYLPRAVDRGLLDLLCACALSAPTKSDLQQRDILNVRDIAARQSIAALIPDMPWIGEAPVFLVFLANGRRLPHIAEARGKPFPNDHLDLFFNATVDAALALATFVTAAEAVGLGCCPISVIRDHAGPVSELLGLPERIVPIAGLCVGWPADAGYVSPRLPLAATVHEDRYDESEIDRQIGSYDRRRAAAHPYRNQRNVARWGTAPQYGWSEDKARQYAEPQRTDFGAFVRRQGFCLD
jgi:nitroreductase/FMN reductase [NAD(P)H]